jgi:hypothetical protein
MRQALAPLRDVVGMGIVSGRSGALPVRGLESVGEMKLAAALFASGVTPGRRP